MNTGTPVPGHDHRLEAAASASPAHTEPTPRSGAPAEHGGSTAGAGAAAPGLLSLRRMGTWVVVLLVVASAALAARQVLTPGLDAEAAKKAAPLSVNTVLPSRTTLVRTHEQPGSVLPYAQAELYAKASGYLNMIRREVNAEVAATLLTQPLLSPGAPLAGALGRSAAAVAVELWRAPLIDIGSYVSAGEVLLDVDVPERDQDVVQAEATVLQRREELAQAEVAIATYQAAVDAARAHKAQADSDVKRYQSEYTYRKMELARVRKLAQVRAVEERLVDEKEAQVGAALAAWESSNAKVQSALADLALANAKLATARADVRVKQALLTVAQANLERTRVLLDYTRLTAPFNGVITFRGVDEGDFVQNAQSGQSRHLMTVTALDKVKVVLQVPSSEGVLVRRGAEAVLTVDSRPGEKFYGWVARTRRLLDQQSRTLQVEIDLDNRDQRLMPGMYGHVTLTLTTTPNAWVIPAAALFSRSKVNYVLLVKDGVARRQPVRIVLDSGDRVSVVKLIDGKEVPLDGTEELVISGKGEIADGQRVNAPPRAGR